MSMKEEEGKLINNSDENHDLESNKTNKTFISLLVAGISFININYYSSYIGIYCL